MSSGGDVRNDVLGALGAVYPLSTVFHARRRDMRPASRRRTRVVEIHGGIGAADLFRRLGELEAADTAAVLCLAVGGAGRVADNASDLRLLVGSLIGGGIAVLAALIVMYAVRVAPFPVVAGRAYGRGLGPAADRTGIRPDARSRAGRSRRDDAAVPRVGGGLGVGGVLGADAGMCAAVLRRPCAPDMIAGNHGDC